MRTIKLSVFLLLLLFNTTQPTQAYQAERVDKDPQKFDRLDGTGESGVRIDVIEWEGNLEIHAYPKNSIAGLGFKLDDSTSGKLVMVISYRFTRNPNTQLIRRAILSIPLRQGFMAFKDHKAGDYDKVVVSNSQLALANFRMDSAPQELYPAGHPMLAEKESNSWDRKPAHAAESRAPENPYKPARPEKDTLEDKSLFDEETGGFLRGFFW